MTEPTSPGADADISTAASPTAASSAKASVWEDFIDIFYAPSTVFARRSTSGFLIPMLVVTIAVGLLYLVNSNVMSQVMDAEMNRAMAKRAQNLTPEQLEKIRGFSLLMAKIGVWIFTPIIMFLVGLALWVVGKFFEAKQTLGQAVMVASYA
jgi:uncharacterized membrane protein